MNLHTISYFLQFFLSFFLKHPHFRQLSRPEIYDKLYDIFITVYSKRMDKDEKRRQTCFFVIRLLKIKLIHFFQISLVFLIRL